MHYCPGHRYANAQTRLDKNRLSFIHRLASSAFTLLTRSTNQFPFCLLWSRFYVYASTLFSLVLSLPLSLLCLPVFFLYCIDLSSLLSVLHRLYLPFFSFTLQAIKVSSCKCLFLKLLSHSVSLQPRENVHVTWPNMN